MLPSSALKECVLLVRRIGFLPTDQKTAWMTCLPVAHVLSCMLQVGQSRAGQGMVQKPRSGRCPPAFEAPAQPSEPGRPRSLKKIEAQKHRAVEPSAVGKLQGPKSSAVSARHITSNKATKIRRHSTTVSHGFKLAAVLPKPMSSASMPPRQCLHPAMMTRPLLCFEPYEARAPEPRLESRATRPGQVQ